MASKKTLKASDFRRSGRGRKVEIKNIRYYYLIVCEGKKTEPLYFNALVAQLPPGVLSVCEFDVKGLGTNTTDLVSKAQELAENVKSKTGRKVDKIWCVFDRDSFPKKTSTVQSAPVIKLMVWKPLGQTKHLNFGICFISTT